MLRVEHQRMLKESVDIQILVQNYQRVLFHDQNHYIGLEKLESLEGLKRLEKLIMLHDI